MTKALLSHPIPPTPASSWRPLVWMRKNLFSSWLNSLLTLLAVNSAAAELSIFAGQLGWHDAR